jgi:hypothetical protein
MSHDNDNDRIECGTYGTHSYKATVYPGITNIANTHIMLNKS